MRVAVSREALGVDHPKRSWAAAAGVHAIVTPCSAQKTVEPIRTARAVSLPTGVQASLETAWVRRLLDLPATVPAANLYRGRGFVTARRAAERTGAKLFIASAGLGLVSQERTVPAYGLTVAVSVVR